MKIVESAVNLNDLIEFFKTDKDLITTFHIEAGTDVENCALRTYKDLMTAENLTYFKIYKDNMLIGYFGKQDFPFCQWLTGFFVKLEFRSLNKEIFTQIKEMFTAPFVISALYTKNERAIKFLKNQNFFITYTDNEKTFLSLRSN